MCFGSVVKRLQLRQLAPVDATCDARRTVFWTTGVDYVDAHSHASGKLVHWLDPSVVKAQTVRELQTREDSGPTMCPRLFAQHAKTWEEREARISQ